MQRHWTREHAQADAVTRARQQRRAYVVAPAVHGQRPWVCATIGEYTRFTSILPAVSYVDATGTIHHGIPPTRKRETLVPKATYHEAEVTILAGSAFPVDMLRYDSCFPSRSEDVTVLAESLSEDARRDQRKCPRCNGAGRYGGEGANAINYATCPRCEGSGRRKRIAVHVARLTPEKRGGVWTVERWRSFGAIIRPHCACCRHQVVAEVPTPQVEPPTILVNGLVPVDGLGDDGPHDVDTEDGRNEPARGIVNVRASRPRRTTARTW